MYINGLHPVYAGIGHCVELIIEQEMAPIFAAFRMSGLAISHVSWLIISFSKTNYPYISIDGCTLDKTMFLVCIRLARNCNIYLCMYTLWY